MMPDRGTGMMDSMIGQARDAWDRLRWGWGGLDEMPPERGRIALVGLPGSGKKTLFNTLWGWSAVQTETEPPPGGLDMGMADCPLPVRDYGMFWLVDLPTEPYNADQVLFQLEEVDLIIYLLDGQHGMRSEDFQWIARLRARPSALMVVLNKADRLGNSLAAKRAELEMQLSLPVFPLSATHPETVRGAFLAAMLKACPKVTVPLASQITTLRRSAALRMIRQSTALSIIASVEPVPLLDVSVLIGLQIHLLNRIGALYGQPSVSQSQGSIIVTVAFGMALRYTAQTLMKFFPFLGWMASGLIGASGTWLVGRAALIYYETDFLNQEWRQQLSVQVQDALHRRLRLKRSAQH